MYVTMSYHHILTVLSGWGRAYLRNGKLW